MIGEIYIAAVLVYLGVWFSANRIVAAIDRNTAALRAAPPSPDEKP